MLKIGITGGIASGKTIVSLIFSKLGVPVYNADTQAKWLMEHDEELRKQIFSLFGETAYLPDGKLNSRYLSSIVFNDPEKLKLLNSIVHPIVEKDFNRWAQVQEFPYILKEAALLYEAGSYKLLDHIIVVTCPAELRIKRVLQRDPYRNREEVESIMKRQLPEEEKIKRADYIINNDEQHLLLPQVLRHHELFREI